MTDRRFLHYSVIFPSTMEKYSFTSYINTYHHSVIVPPTMAVARLYMKRKGSAQWTFHGCAQNTPSYALDRKRSAPDLTGNSFLLFQPAFFPYHGAAGNYHDNSADALQQTQILPQHYHAKKDRRSDSIGGRLLKP